MLRLWGFLSSSRVVCAERIEVGMLDVLCSFLCMLVLAKSIAFLDPVVSRPQRRHDWSQ